jgi:hypothetical protein
MAKGKGMHLVSWVLVIIGGLNWLLVGVFNWDIGALFGGMSAAVSRIIYILVGLAAIYELFTHKSSCKPCGSETGGGGTVAPSV